MYSFECYFERVVRLCVTALGSGREIEDNRHLQDTMQKITMVLPDRGYAVVVGGLVETEFETQEGATKGTRELKGRFPALQIKIYDAGTKSDQEVVLP